MKSLTQTIMFLRLLSEAELIGNHSPTLTARLIVALLLGEQMLTKALLVEASIHRSRRSKVYVATFTGAAGGQVWRTTGLTEYEPALLRARQWEAEARAERVKLGRTPSKAGTRVYRSQTGTSIGLSQKEVGRILGLSVRCVAATEKRALRKLLDHPLLKELWRQYLSGELDEQSWVLDPAEIAALFDLARTPEELRLIEKALLIVQNRTQKGT